MIIIYIFKLTDNNVYIYNKKKAELIKERIGSGIIKDNKIYNVNKAIYEINEILREYHINNSFFKTRIKVILNKSLTPAEMFCFKTVLKNLINVNYIIIYEEDYLLEKNEILIWDNILLINKTLKNLNDLSKKDFHLKDYILIGASDEFESVKNKLINYNLNILEYENSNTIIFERI